MRAPILNNKTIDETDLTILRTLLELDKRGEDVTTSRVARDIFDIKDRKDYQEKDNIIRKRLKKLTEAGLVIESEEEENNRVFRTYNVDPDSIVMGDTVLEVKPDWEEDLNGEGKTYRMDVKNMLFIKNGNGFIIYGRTGVEGGTESQD